MLLIIRSVFYKILVFWRILALCLVDRYSAEYDEQILHIIVSLLPSIYHSIDFYYGQLFYFTSFQVQAAIAYGK